ncbi:MAG: ribonuclease PH [Candidatus Omnitrophica bacterium]|jgi:ribonuclease PH|nr:ribonuclease PH [Candidatus Omnitrophota bacterium]
MKRIDNRAFEELRKINIERDYIKYADGSCLIEVGNTRVICTATVDRNVPLFLRNSGTGWVTSEYGMLPRSTQIRIPRDKNSGRTMEIQRLIGRSLRSVVDLRNIGERTIYIDCDVIQADGGTRVASIVGGFCALTDSLHKLFKSGTIAKMCITDFLGAISVGIWKGKYILDLNFAEDSDAEVDMNIVMKSSGEFIELQGTGEHGSFSKDDLNALIDLGKSGIEEIIDMERNLFKDILPNV